MSSRDTASARLDRRWWRENAALWIQPDAARWLKPGVNLYDAFPALRSKAYNPDQPRVPAGDPDGGQWTSGYAGVDYYGDDAPASATPMGEIDFGDISSELRSLDLFRITPDERDTSDDVRLAGDPPLPDDPREPPEIPSRRPDTTEGRMRFVRAGARFLRAVGRYSPLADVFFSATDQVEGIRGLVDVIRSASDPSQSLEDARNRRYLSSEPGYQDHHIVGQHRQNRDRFGDALIDSRDNVVRIPTLQHFNLNSWYSTPNEEFGNMSPRDYLRDKSFDEQMRVGLKVLRDRGVIR